MSMFDNITDDKVDFYCDNRLCAIEDLDFILTELRKMHGLALAAGETSTALRLDALIARFKDE